ncbi:WxL domain-containing protein [Enterococcus mundtii]|uniref:WxL domain-containing protein n=1 Tax=Enterococcus mundtii TaxID=53346 RepID=A0A1V2UAY6_ENTMU|nr:WxL domain-containing protein [Enterococcus mundtii]ONN40435.1 hypothetical protein BTN92_15010 [Enterococcus mundtii]
MKKKKLMALISTSFLCIQSLIFPISVGVTSSVYAIEQTEEVMSSELPTSHSYLDGIEAVDPTFTFQDRRTTNNVGEPFSLFVHVDQEIKKFVLTLPKEAILVKEELTPGVTIEETEENQWEVESETPQQRFSIPLSFEEEGTYEASVGEATITLEIKGEEELKPDEEVTIGSSQEEPMNTEETKDEAQGAASSEKTTENSTDGLDENLENPQKSEPMNRDFSSSERASESNAINVVEVGTWDELNRAVLNTFTGAETYKNNSDYIKITNNIENPSNLGNDTRRNAPANRVDFVIDGQGHTVDFNSVRYTWAANVNIERNIYIKNINMYGQSAYGPFAIGDTARLGSTLTYENVYYRGSQLTASWQANMVFKGNNEFYSVNSYVSPISGVTKNTWANQSGLEAFRATFEEDSTTIMEVENGNGLILASFLGNTGQTLRQDAYARLAKNAKVEIKTLGNSGEIVGTGLNIIGLAKGNLILEESSSLDISTLENSTRGGINLTANTAVEIANHAKLNININGEMRTSAITLGTSANVKVSDYGALNINLKNQGSSTRDVVSVGANSEFDIGKEGDFAIKVEDGNGIRNLMNVGANGIFQFDDSNKVDLDSRNNQNAHLVNMTNPGTFKSAYQNVTAWRKGTNTSDTPDFNWEGLALSLITYNNREITNISALFSDSQVRTDFQTNYRTTASGNPHNGFSRVFFDRVPDIDLTINSLSENKNNENSHVITGKATPGSIIQFSGDPAIPTADLIEGHTKADENGEYLYKLPEGRYFTGRNTVTANSTLGIRRATASTVVKSNVIGTVTVKHQSVDGQQLADPKTIEGIVGDSYATNSEEFDGWKLVGIPENASGEFSADPISVTYIYEEVLEKGPVSPLDPLEPEVEVDPENKPDLPEDQGLLSIDFVSSFNFGSQSISVHDQTYYAQPQRLLNEDGTVNEKEERPNYVQISDRRPETERNGWELAVTQKEQFKGKENQVLNGASISLSNQQVVTAQGGTVPGLQSVSCEIIPGNRRILLKAQGNEGIGTWIYRFGDADTAKESVALNVPRGANPEATSYSTNLIWELSAVPDN